jgi:hypothetical protein
LDLQEDPSPLPGDLRIDHHCRLFAAHQVWQGPYWAVCTHNHHHRFQTNWPLLFYSVKSNARTTEESYDIVT